MRFLNSLFICSTLAIDSTLLMMMMQQNGNQNQANQMDNLLPFLLMSDSDTESTENSDLLMMMMMQGGNMGDMSSILPLLMLSDDSMDFQSLFLMTNMMNQGRLHTLFNFFLSF